MTDISFTLPRGKMLGIIGRSGAGKSTLLRCLNGLERPDTGRVVVDGEVITGRTEQELRVIRQRIGMIFQHFNLLSAKTVIENVTLPLKLQNVPRVERQRRGEELLEMVGLGDKAHDLSGKTFGWSETACGNCPRVGLQSQPAAV